MTRAWIIGTGAALAAFGAPARGDVAVQPHAMVSPFEQATMELEWVRPMPGFSGVIRWFSPDAPDIVSDVFNIATAEAGRTWTAPTLYDYAQGVVLGYAPTPGGPTVFDSASPHIGSLVQIRTDGPGSFALRSEAIQGAVTDDSFFANAMILVRFAQLPAPGAGSFLAAGLFLGVRRRR